MKPSVLRLAVLPFLLLAAAGAPAVSDAASGVKWRGWDSGLEEARASGRPVLVDVYTDWCGWCRRMDAQVYSRPDVLDYLSRKFVTVKINAEAADPAFYQDKSYTSRSLAARFGVSGYPTTIFLRPAGEHLVNVPGYMDADRFLLMLRYIGDGHMDKGVTFQDFVKRAGTDRAGRR